MYPANVPYKKHNSPYLWMNVNGKEFRLDANNNISSFDNGSSFAPSITFNNDLSTGLYLPKRSQLNITVDSNVLMQLSDKVIVNSVIGLKDTDTHPPKDKDIGYLLKKPDGALYYITADNTYNLTDYSSGTSQRPRYSFTKDKHTGIYLVDVGRLGLSINGRNKVEFGFRATKFNTLIRTPLSKLPTVCTSEQTGIGSAVKNILDFYCDGKKVMYMGVGSVKIPSAVLSIASNTTLPSLSFTSDMTSGLSYNKDIIFTHTKNKIMTMNSRRVSILVDACARSMTTDQTTTTVMNTQTIKFGTTVLKEINNKLVVCDVDNNVLFDFKQIEVVDYGKQINALEGYTSSLTNKLNELQKYCKEKFATRYEPKLPNNLVDVDGKLFYNNCDLSTKTVCPIKHTGSNSSILTYYTDDGTHFTSTVGCISVSKLNLDNNILCSKGDKLYYNDINLLEKPKYDSVLHITNNTLVSDVGFSNNLINTKKLSTHNITSYVVDAKEITTSQLSTNTLVTTDLTILDTRLVVENDELNWYQDGKKYTLNKLVDRLYFGTTDTPSIVFDTSSGIYYNSNIVIKNADNKVCITTDGITAKQYTFNNGSRLYTDNTHLYYDDYCLTQPCNCFDVYKFTDTDLCIYTSSDYICVDNFSTKKILIDGLSITSTSSSKFNPYQCSINNIELNRMFDKNVAVDVIVAKNGTIEAPSYTFEGDRDTGFRLVLPNTVAYTSNGTDSILFTNDGLRTTQLTINNVDISEKNGFIHTDMLSTNVLQLDNSLLTVNNGRLYLNDKDLYPTCTEMKLKNIDVDYCKIGNVVLCDLDGLHVGDCLTIGTNTLVDTPLGISTNSLQTNTLHTNEVVLYDEEKNTNTNIEFYDNTVHCKNLNVEKIVINNNEFIVDDDYLRYSGLTLQAVPKFVAGERLNKHDIVGMTNKGLFKVHAGKWTRKLTNSIVEKDVYYFDTVRFSLLDNQLVVNCLDDQFNGLYSAKIDITYDLAKIVQLEESKFLLVTYTDNTLYRSIIYLKDEAPYYTIDTTILTNQLNSVITDFEIVYNEFMCSIVYSAEDVYCMLYNVEENLVGYHAKVFEAMYVVESVLNVLEIPGQILLIAMGNNLTYILLPTEYTNEFTVTKVLIESDVVSSVNFVYDVKQSVILSVWKTYSNTGLIKVYDITSQLVSCAIIDIPYLPMGIHVCNAIEKTGMTFMVFQLCGNTLLASKYVGTDLQYTSRLVVECKNIKVFKGKKFIVECNDVYEFDDEYGIPCYDYIGVVCSDVPKGAQVEVTMRGGLHKIELSADAGQKIYYSGNNLLSYTTNDNICIGTYLGGWLLLK